MIREASGIATTVGADTDTSTRGVDIDGEGCLEQIQWAGPTLISTPPDDLFEVGLRIVLDGIGSVLHPARGAATP